MKLLLRPDQLGERITTEDINALKALWASDPLTDVTADLTTSRAALIAILLGDTSIERAA